MRDLCGIINIYKETGYTSHDAVAVVRKILGVKRVGHTGTLDPAAEGVLPVCVGRATKLADYIQAQTKVYRAGIRFGLVTDTDDITGNVTRREDANIPEAELNRVLEAFIGETDQVPPMYSAIKMGGRKLYSLAREGKEIERPARRVIIHKIELLTSGGQAAEIAVTCGKGTYIRALIRDIGERLGCGACMESLLRLKNGDFAIEDSVTLGKLGEAARAGDFSAVAPVDKILRFPAVYAKKEAGKILENGGRLPLSLTEGARPPAGGKCFVYGGEGELAGLYEADGAELKVRVKIGADFTRTP
ncbi:MAG: tRNA pseudouridine(55) synthase TruB [Clostridiales bacterium]|jgi:tRNA pseudouridine55 synthase|nr:tRNA pseudouridine(55) synthase TruB [Clostridiales bacterium]